MNSFSRRLDVMGTETANFNVGEVVNVQYEEHKILRSENQEKHE